MIEMIINMIARIVIIIMISIVLKLIMITIITIIMIKNQVKIDRLKISAVAANSLRLFK